MGEKLVAWLGSSLEELRKFPDDARREAVYVVHAFPKRTRKTPQSAIDLARKRLTDLVRRRRQEQEGQ